MPKMKITVLKKEFYQDLADEYCQPDTSLCQVFAEGQEFIIEDGNKPENFCGWAWNDIHKCYLTLRHGGDFVPWMKEDNVIIACCTDGIRPVVFKVERVAD